MRQRNLTPSSPRHRKSIRCNDKDRKEGRSFGPFNRVKATWLFDASTRANRVTAASRVAHPVAGLENTETASGSQEVFPPVGSRGYRRARGRSAGASGWREEAPGRDP